LIERSIGRILKFTSSEKSQRWPRFISDLMVILPSTTSCMNLGQMARSESVTAVENSGPSEKMWTMLGTHAGQRRSSPQCHMAKQEHDQEPRWQFIGNGRIIMLVSCHGGTTLEQFQFAGSNAWRDPSSAERWGWPNCGNDNARRIWPIVRCLSEARKVIGC
jgi:hypothetical protein